MIPAAARSAARSDGTLGVLGALGLVLIVVGHVIVGRVKDGLHCQTQHAAGSAQ